MLRTLAGEPHSAELQAALDVPRATAGRIVTEAELPLNGKARASERGAWAVRIDDRRAFLVAELDSLIDRTETVRKLSRVAQWLPVAELGVPLDRLADATVTTPHHGDPTAPVRRAEELTREADYITFLSDASSPTSTRGSGSGRPAMGRLLE